jgi:phosphate transport system substrate-binding protein
MLLNKLKFIALILLASLFAFEASAIEATVSGAGASFPDPVVQAWAAQFAKENKIEVSYRSIGSSEGIRQVTAKSIDFALTDVPLTQAELIQDDLIQFPLVAGAIVPVVNIPGVRSGDFKLTGSVLADIYLGKITRWNAPELRALNPELPLPDMAIKPAFRGDGSGTSFVFTHYLSKVSQEWHERFGIGSRLNWPVGAGVKGNEGMSLMVRDTTGAIGYVEFSYALKHQLAMVELANKAGKFVRANETGIRSALASAKWARASYYEMLTNRDGEATWPIVGVSFVLIHKTQPDLTDAQETLSFFDWIFHRGNALATAFQYISLEDKSLIERIQGHWKDIKTAQGQLVWKNR